MYLGEELTLYRKDGSTFTARLIQYEKDSEFADGLFYEGRMIYCQSDELGVFWFADTKEKVFDFPPT
jgi:hypothetical protein